MNIINIPLECPTCKDHYTVQVDTFLATHKILDASKKVGRYDCFKLVDYYKKLKGLEELSTWQQSKGPAAFRTAKRLLFFFRKLEDPVGVAIELMNDTRQAAETQGWSWTLETCFKRADDWLLQKQRGKK